jgi:hypothetical protein
MTGGATDPAVIHYHDRRAAEYDDWYLSEGLFAERDRPGWEDEMVKKILILAVLGALAVGCTGLHQEHPVPAQTARPTGTPGLAKQQFRFRVFGSPPPPGARCTTPSRTEGAYGLDRRLASRARWSR